MKIPTSARHVSCLPFDPSAARLKTGSSSLREMEFFRSNCVFQLHEGFINEADNILFRGAKAAVLRDRIGRGRRLGKRYYRQPVLSLLRWSCPSRSIIGTNEASSLKGSLYQRCCILFERICCGRILVATRTSKSSPEILIGLLSEVVLSTFLRAPEHSALETYPNDPPEPHRLRSDP
jgi:hypothetical protein